MLSGRLVVFIAQRTPRSPHHGLNQNYCFGESNSILGMWYHGSRGKSQKSVRIEWQRLKSGGLVSPRPTRADGPGGQSVNLKFARPPPANSTGASLIFDLMASISGRYIRRKPERGANGGLRQDTLPISLHPARGSGSRQSPLKLSDPLLISAMKCKANFRNLFREVMKQGYPLNLLALHEKNEKIGQTWRKSGASFSWDATEAGGITGISLSVRSTPFFPPTFSLL